MADRTQEHLGNSDGGVIMMRRRLMGEARLIADGGEPKALVRDEELNRCMPLPIIGRNGFVDGTPPGVTIGEGQNVGGDRNFIFLYGQPPDMTLAYREAMGLEAES